MATMDIAELEELVSSAFVAANTAEPVARSVAKALVLAEIDGRKGHGLSRVESYTAQARSGKVDGHAAVSFKQTADAALLLDVANGFAYPAFDQALQKLPQIAMRSGIAMAGFTRSHHFGVAGHQVERLADAGLVAIAFGNTPAAMAPWGGKRALFGTNPIAFAAPRLTGVPFVIDLALSQVARGNVLKASQAGKPIPEGWAFDAEGNPTTDAEAALGGTMAPLGGAKGAALALMVEVLAAALPDANFAFEASSFFTGDGPPPGVGQLLLVMHPGAFGSAERVLERIEHLCATIDSEDGARLPGQGRIALREKARDEGLEVADDMLAALRGMAEYR